MTTNNTKDSQTMWQTSYEGEGISEPALLITPYSYYTIGIQQEGKEVLINTASIKEFLKAIKEAADRSEALSK